MPEISWNGVSFLYLWRVFLEWSRFKLLLLLLFVIDFIVYLSELQNRRNEEPTNKLENAFDLNKYWTPLNLKSAWEKAQLLLLVEEVEWGEANSKQADCCRHKSINKRKQTQRDFHYLYFFPSIKYGKINEPLMSQEKTKFEKINFNCEKRKKHREITKFFNEYSWNCLNFEEVVHPNYDLGNSMFVFF